MMAFFEFMFKDFVHFFGMCIIFSGVFAFICNMTSVLMKTSYCDDIDDLLMAVEHVLVTIPDEVRNLPAYVHLQEAYNDFMED